MAEPVRPRVATLSRQTRVAGGSWEQRAGQRRPQGLVTRPTPVDGARKGLEHGGSMSRYRYFVENGLRWLAFVLLVAVGLAQGHASAVESSASGLVSIVPWGAAVATLVLLLRAALMGKRQADGTYLWSGEARREAMWLALGLGLVTVLLIAVEISGISPWRVSPPPVPTQFETPRPL